VSSNSNKLGRAGEQLYLLDCRARRFGNLGVRRRSGSLARSLAAMIDSRSFLAPQADCAKGKGTRRETLAPDVQLGLKVGGAQSPAHICKCDPLASPKMDEGF